MEPHSVLVGDKKLAEKLQHAVTRLNFLLG